MEHVKKSIWSVLMILILFPTHCLSQRAEGDDSPNVQLRKAAREIMTAAGTCALITIDEEGLPRVRAMDAFLPEEDFTVWFGTNPKSRKVSQIKNNPNVCLYYADKDGSGYVTINGTAELVNDDAVKEKRWKEEWQAFYPNKTDDYLLIKVSPKRMEVVSYSRGIVSTSPTWEPPSLTFDSN